MAVLDPSGNPETYPPLNCNVDCSTSFPEHSECTPFDDPGEVVGYDNSIFSNPNYLKWNYGQTIITSINGTHVPTGTIPPSEASPEEILFAVYRWGGETCECPEIYRYEIESTGEFELFEETGSYDVYHAIITTKYVYLAFYYIDDCTLDAPPGWEWSDDNTLEPIVCDFCELEVSYKISDNGV